MQEEYAMFSFRKSALAEALDAATVQVVPMNKAVFVVEPKGSAPEIKQTAISDGWILSAYWQLPQIIKRLGAERE